MKITCMSCRSFAFEFEVSELDFDRAPVIALTCPQCNKSTAIAQRPGGGIEVAVDKHLEKQRG